MSVTLGATVGESAEVRAFLADVGTDGPVAVEGGRTRWSVGGDPVGDPRLVRAPSGIVEYKPEEMVVRVGAGTPVAELEATLAEAGQRSALPERGGTVGGAIVVGENRLDALGRGMIRSAILQVAYVSAEGRLVVGGGPTVKNVSGFDLPRLITGSLGTLGLVAEVILRTNPVPAVSRWFAGEADPFILFDALLGPSAILWDGERTWLQLEGHPTDVHAELAKARQVGVMDEVEHGPDIPEGIHRWSLRPSELRTLPSTLRTPWLASIGFGIVLAHDPPEPRALPAAVVAVHDRMKRFFDPEGRLNPGRNAAT